MTFKFNEVYLNSTATVTGPYENEGPLKGKFDKSYENLYNGEKSWEKAEIKLFEESIDILLNKSKKKKDDIDVVIGGDLQNQIAASCYGTLKFKRPFLGIYSACTTSTEGLILGSVLIDSKRVKNAVVTVSSHNMASEKQFRNPTEYGAPKPKTATFTTTGGASALISSTKSKVKLESGTIGKMCDMNQSDPNNMGAAMAVAAADTIYTHLKDMKRSPEYYDLIITGDLGVYGSRILLEYMKSEYGLDISENHKDSGTMIYDVNNTEEVMAGGSGPACSPLVNYSYTVPLLEKGSLNKVLIVATGALFSPTAIYQKEPIISISHAVSLESVK